MDIKIQMLNIGDADAIIVQLKKNDQVLTLLIDGGKIQEHANKIIKYFEDYHLTPDVIICTHLDYDHIGGLKYIVKEYYQQIKAIWVHRPENHESTLRRGLEIDSKSCSKSERRELIISSLKDLDSFIDEAEKNGLKDSIFEPFSDSTEKEVLTLCANWGIKILGPSKEFYESLLSCFRSYSPAEFFEESMLKTLEPCNAIGKEGNDAPENESSLIFQISNGDKGYLFTGDAGLQAFKRIKDKLGKVYWLKIPHHGSRKNLDKELIQKLSPERCFISAIGENGHPDSNLVKCLTKHGADKILCTGIEGNNLIEES